MVKTKAYTMQRAQRITCSFLISQKMGTLTCTNEDLVGRNRDQNCFTNGIDHC